MMLCNIFVCRQFFGNLGQERELYEKISDRIIFSDACAAFQHDRRVCTGRSEKSRPDYPRVYCLRRGKHEDKFYPPEHERCHIGGNRHREPFGRSGV